MAINIDTDLQRFRRKIEQAKRDGLKRYIETGSQGVITGDGKKLKIPIQRLHLPRFRFNFEKEGIGQGEGEIGDRIIGPWNPNPVDDQISDDEEDGDIPSGKRSRDCYDPYEHQYVDVERKEVARGLEEYLKLPNLRDTFGGNTIVAPSTRYTGIRRTGPKGLVHCRRTFKEALKRELAAGSYDPSNPLVIPRKEDMRFKAPDNKPDSANAVAVFLIDCSGSMMGNLEFLQDVAWMADVWIEDSYPNMARRYVHYDHAARESTREDFFNITAGGENQMGIAYQIVHQILQEYPPDQFNRYVVHLTDGDLYGLTVTEEQVESYIQMAEEYPEEFPPMKIQTGNPLTELILPEVNGLFVCEAGSYYDHGVSPEDGKDEIWPGQPGYNFSVLLEHMCKKSIHIRKKVRWTAFDDDGIKNDWNECKLITIREWFGGDNSVRNYSKN